MENTNQTVENTENNLEPQEGFTPEGDFEKSEAPASDENENSEENVVEESETPADDSDAEVPVEQNEGE